jgi:ATP-binding cassette, subfamily C, bacteriocin exporter
MFKWRSFRPVLASNSKDCGLAALASIIQHYGVTVSVEALRKYVPLDLQGTSLASLAAAASKLGLTVAAGQAKGDVLRDIPLPAIAHLNTEGIGHFVTIFRVSEKHVHLADPSLGLTKCSHEAFLKKWSFAIILFDGSLNSAASELRATWAVPRLFELFRSDLSNIWVIAILSFVATITGTASSWVLSQIFNRLLQTKNPLDSFILSLLVVLAVCRISANVMAKRLSSIVGSRFEMRAGTRYLATLITSPLLFIEGRSVGDYVGRLMDIARIRRTILGVTASLAVDAVLLLAICTCFIRITLWSSIGLFALLVVVGIVITTAGRTLFSVYLSTRQQTALLQTEFVEKVGNIRTVKALSAEQSLVESFTKIFREVIKGILDGETAALWMDGLLQTLTAIFMIVVLTLSVRSVATGKLSLGGLAMIVALSTYFSASIERAAPTLASLQEAGVSAISLLDSMEHMPRQPAVTPMLALAREAEALHLKVRKIQFHYPNSQPILVDLSLEILAGEHVCIVGESGCGKSTLACLLAGLYEPTVGTIIALGGISDRVYSNIRSHSSIVFQEAGLMSGSIRSNIAFGLPKGSDEKVIEAARLAEAHEFIKCKAQGYDYDVGPRGTLLSTGQRQRIAIARAFLRNPPILVLDEATSGIDPATEARILENLANYRKDLTTIVITHRLKTALSFNRCIVLTEGHVVADGDPKIVLPYDSDLQFVNG